MEKRTFTLSLKCGNCYKEFSEDIPVGKIVKKSSGGGLVYMSGTPQFIRCPQCETSEMVHRNI